ncbi:MAG: glucose 1-dehydrogenase [Deltaproteobacteria bacterium]|nr:MAG: glucose 1-dehydrogenase [Deltaproteobacteria bacterium]TMA49555.1 MAG: glucose 1-dehydrogenase [Deltaproteobacteria bacterium]TMA79414.1 MAG: glucose 1-dehydrogenase [Deltaproteobacteria bacterium]
MTGAVALVTGGGRGIGRAIAQRLARSGGAVGIADLDGPAAEGVAAEIRASGGRAAGVGADVSDLGAVRAAVGALEASLGPVDVLVNNAGWDQLELFVENDPDLWDRLIAVNLKGVLHTTRTLLDGMIARRRGRIVSISSDAARVGSTGEAVYAACKAGVIGFSKALAREVARHRITVNVVCPGPTETALLAATMAGERGVKILEGMRRAIPLGRLGQPEDVAGAVAYLVSDEASYVTGQVLSVSGGLTMAG